LTIGEWLKLAELRLVNAGIVSPKLESQLLAAHVLGESRPYILTHSEVEIPEMVGEALLQRREAREPLAYITGKREFYSREFKVSPSVLIPRQETECVVDTAIELIKSHDSVQTVLDLCTGCGCIAISLALETNAKVVGSDISASAIEIARHNGESHSANVEWLESDGFTEIVGRKFDLIVSNPPYLKRGEIFMPEVAKFEPEIALYAGSDGLEAYRWIAREAPKCLNKPGFVLIETGWGMSDDVRKIFADCGFEYLKSRKDLLKIDRALLFRRER
jgi:release factor glutamine methyltransferase